MNSRRVAILIGGLVAMFAIAALIASNANGLLRPIIAFDEVEVVVKEPSSRDNVVRLTFIFSNRGYSELCIQDVSAISSCCSRVVDFTKNVSPRGTGHIRVEVKTTPVGQYQVPFAVRCNDPVRSETTLRASVLPSNDPPFFLSKPSNPLRIHDVWKLPVQATCVIETVEKSGNQRWVNQLSCDDPRVELTTKEEPRILHVVGPYVVVRYRYDLSLRELPAPGLFSAQIGIKTQDFEHPFHLQFGVLGPVQLVPSVVFVSERSRDYVVELSARDPGFELSAKRPSDIPGWIVIEKLEDKEPSVERFSIRCTNSAPDSTLTRVTFSSNHPQCTSVELPVCVQLRSVPNGD
jgi:hypothetical protein